MFTKLVFHCLINILFENMNLGSLEGGNLNLNVTV